MVVPVMCWIGERIAAVEALSCQPVPHGLEKRTAGERLRRSTRP